MATQKAKKPKKNEKSGTRFRTIRVTSEVYDQVHKVVGDVGQKGWGHFGVERRDAASITSVVSEAVERFVKSAR